MMTGPEPSTCGCFERGFRVYHADNCPLLVSPRPRSEIEPLRAEIEQLRALLTAARALLQHHKAVYPDEIDEALEPAPASRQREP